jgi:hypothetical protein
LLAASAAFTFGFSGQQGLIGPTLVVMPARSMKLLSHFTRSVPWIKAQT